MEALILGCYVLTEIGSVMLLRLFGALRLVGTPISPLFGVAGLCLLSFALTLGVQERAARRTGGSITSRWRALADGVADVRTTPPLVAAIALAVLLNVAA